MTFGIKRAVIRLNVLILIVLFSCNSQIRSDSDYLATQCKPTIDLFFKSLKDGTYQAGLISLLKSNSNISLQDSLTTILEKRFDVVNLTSGKFKSDSLLRKNQIGDDLVVYSYLVKYDYNCFRFLFTFYNNGDSVKLFKFSFDDNIGTELEEGIKFYLK